MGWKFWKLTQLHKVCLGLIWFFLYHFLKLMFFQFHHSIFIYLFGDWSSVFFFSCFLWSWFYHFVFDYLKSFYLLLFIKFIFKINFILELKRTDLLNIDRCSLNLFFFIQFSFSGRCFNDICDFFWFCHLDFYSRIWIVLASFL